ncbi:DnaJ domain family protein [Babesia bovis T2Bo]|uniref:DnaJ domain family protein n=1 Tax=Babesia bovis T2Bo TaxID=484906 RepID=UPI001D49E7FB|nr:DnaJ domain family protein [Babesia bovis T2Bo]EDO07027.2 DnaJ domain family protein [Babesia bovis T2Bo]
MAETIKSLLDECCYYKILGVEFDATNEDIRKKYLERARTYHPDKRPPEEKDDCNIVFHKIQQAYECLSNKENREWYNKNRQRILKSKKTHDKTEFDIWYYFRPCYNGFDESKPNNFYQVYSKCFAQIVELEKEELIHEGNDDIYEYPPFGTSQSTSQDVNKFYKFWHDFVTVRTFICEENWEIEGRMNRRFVERQYKKENSKLKKEYNDNVRNLVNIVKKVDPRVQRIKEEQNELKMLKELDKLKVQQKIEAMKHVMKEEIVNNMKDNIHEIEMQRELLRKQEVCRVFASHYEEDKPQVEKEYFPCEVCNKVFGSNNQLENHLRSKQHIKNAKLK